MQGLFTRNGSHSTGLLILAMTALSGAAGAQTAPALRATNQSLLALHDDAGTSLMAAAAIDQLNRVAALAATPIITENTKGGAAPAATGPGDDAQSFADVVGGVSDGKFATAEHFFDVLGSLQGSASSNASAGGDGPLRPYYPGIVAHSDQLRPDNPDLPNQHGVPGGENGSGKLGLRSSSVPAPGPAALLLIAGGASSLRRRRRR